MDVSQNEGCPINAGESIEIAPTRSDFDNLLEIVICVKHLFPMGSRHSGITPLNRLPNWFGMRTHPITNRYLVEATRRSPF